AVRTVREHRRPLFLHLRTVRFLGHAGSDAEISYRKLREIEADYDRDPLLGTARELIAGGVPASDVLDRYLMLRAEIDTEVDRLRDKPGLRSAAAVMAPLAPRHPAAVAEATYPLQSRPGSRPRTLAESINATL